MKKLLVYTIVAIGLFSLAGASMASAHGWFGRGWANIDPDQFAQRQSQIFEQQAQLLGITVEQMKEYWAEGKNMTEIMEELGIDKEELQNRMKQLRQESMAEQLQILVAKGVITQEQAERRLQVMAEWPEKGGIMGGCPHRGFGFKGPREFNNQ